MIDYSPIRFYPSEEKIIGTGHGHSVMNTKNFGTPRAHYLIYVFQGTSLLDARRIFDPNIDNIEQSEAELYNIVRGTKGSPAYLGQGFTNMSWRFPCYITIILENEGWDWQSVASGHDDAISFIARKNGIDYHENYSFYNGVHVTVPVINGGGQTTGARNAFRFENHIKADAQGNDLKKNEWRRYKFNLNVLVPTAGGGPATPNSIDPDGGNQGPSSIP
jgi:hypothetical protein